MVVKGLMEGLAAEERRLKAELVKTSAEYSVGTFKTPLGPASVSSPQPSIEIIPDDFLGYCAEHHPGMLEEVLQVKEWFVTSHAKTLRIAGSDVVDADGVVVEYARVKPAGAPYVSARLSSEVKLQATAQVAAALDGLMGLLQIEASR